MNKKVIFLYVYIIGLFLLFGYIIEGNFRINYMLVVYEKGVIFLSLVKLVFWIIK